MKRREFFSKTATGVGAAGFFAASGPAAAARPAADAPLLTRPLGGTGLRLPVVNMGVMNADNPDLVRRAYERGMRHFDTAASYARGRNEEMVGNVIRDLGVRDDVVIATKVVSSLQKRGLDRAGLKRAFLDIFEGSLRRLKMDHVEILYIHDALDLATVDNEGFLDALAQAKKDGKARFVGFSTHSNMAALLNEAVRLGTFDVVLVAFNYALAEDAALFEALRAAAGKGLGLIAMKTQCMQDWYKDFVPAEGQGFYKEGIVQSAVLKWALQPEFITCAVPGFTTFEELEADVAVARDIRFTPEDRKFLEDRNVRLAMGTCVQCRGCLGSCPRGVDVPVLMRAYVYTRYPNFGQARDAVDALPAGAGLAVCADCDACAARCRGRVDIARRIGELRTIFG